MTRAAALLPVSIVVCTRNRAESLGRTLAALAGLEVGPLPAVELVVVDNGSTDGTAEVVRQAAATFPYPLRLVSCPEKGLSRARNAGVAAARHDLILFTDDDCLPKPDWAVRLAAAYGDNPLQLIGGPVIDLPDDWDGSESGRQAAEARAWIRPRGVVKGPEDVPGFVIGANFSFGRAVFDRIGSFDTRLGAGSSLHAAEEIDFVYRAHKSSIPIVFEPDAMVLHDHRRDSATLARMFFRYCVGEGALAAKHLFAGDPIYLKVRYWGFFSEIRASRKGIKPFSYVPLYALGVVVGAVRMSLHIGWRGVRGRLGLGAACSAVPAPSHKAVRRPDA